MKRVLVGLLVAGLMVGGFAPRASAQVEDVEVIVGNLPAAGSALVAGLQEALDTLTSTQSAVDTSGDVGSAVVAFGSALVVGTDQFGALGLGFLLLNSSVQGAVEPYLTLIDDQSAIFGALDDPSMIDGVFNADDVATLLANLPQVPEDLLEGGGFGGLRSAIIEALKGNFVETSFIPGTGQPALMGDALSGVLTAAQTLTAGTNYESLTFPVLVGVILVAGLSEGPLLQAEEALAPLFEAGDPAFAPLIEFLEGFSL